MNQNLQAAKATKNDEFYTLYEDIEAELKHYTGVLKGKVIYCNCDTLRISNFIRYFIDQFEELGIKRLIATGYNPSGHGFYLGMVAERIIIRTLKGDGAFASDECVALLKKADIVISNPPFSLFPEYINLLLKYRKDFLIVGNRNAVTYKSVFPLIKSNKIRIGARGMNSKFSFRTPDDELKTVPACWFTTLKSNDRKSPLELTASYNPAKYPRYDNYSAINVNRVEDIPGDYCGVMGVPITFIGKYNPEQFEIIGATESEGRGFSNGLWNAESKVSQPMINSTRLYKRVFIRRVHCE